MMNDAIRRQQLRIKGQVQGVGFRPFIYRLAQFYHLTGFVQNSLEGVLIEVEGDPRALDQFHSDVQQNAPPLASITSIDISSIPVQFSMYFHIHKSRSLDGIIQTSITPDSAICPDCLTEFHDHADRRYHYPFINCTNCGPRFSIVTGLPYDRPQTTMAMFTMCEACQAEYQDPANRRFHAQPNACPDCGPHVELLNQKGKRIKCADVFSEVREKLKLGAIVALKGLGGYHLVCNAYDDAAVQLLRRRKQRPTKPFAIMVRDLTIAHMHVLLNKFETEALQSISAPIVLAEKNKPLILSEKVAPQNPYLGVLLPYMPIHYLLFDDDLTSLVMTSGNVSNRPIYFQNDEALKGLASVVDCFLIHNRSIHTPCEDSIITFMGNQLTYLRRSRGIVPQAIDVMHDGPVVLGVGGELKNEVCFLKRGEAFFSQHIGDLNHPESCSRFRASIRHLSDILDIRPKAIACDMHPDYYTTIWSKQQSELPVFEVQHHFAHLVSCLSENHWYKPAIGLAMDGTGYGTDGQAWGGEVMLVSPVDFQRIAHFEYRDLPGGSYAIVEPWRMALSYCLHAFEGISARQVHDFAQFSHVNPVFLESFIQIYRNKKRGSIQTSSLGRLFDGVSALLGFRGKISYEGEAAIDLENCLISIQRNTSRYQFILNSDREPWTISPDPVIRALMEDVKQGREKSEISYHFHLAVANILTEICRKIRDERGLHHVALSGGCFQNKALIYLLKQQLKDNQFTVFTHLKVPPNDGGIALGQAVIARNRMKNE